MINLHSEQERLQTMLSACYAAVQLNFRHLPLRSVINPPHECFDAHLARQIALHLFASQFDAPRKRIMAMTGLGQTAVRGAMITVDSRLEEPVFELAYRRMARRAHVLFDRLAFDEAA